MFHAFGCCGSGVALVRFFDNARYGEGGVSWLNRQTLAPKGICIVTPQVFVVSVGSGRDARGPTTQGVEIEPSLMPT